AWTSLAAGLGSLASACAPAPLPSRLGLRAIPSAAPSSTGSSDMVASSPPDADPPRDTPTAAENRRVGDPGWDVRVTVPQGAHGFLDQTSVEPGDVLGLHVVSSSAYDIDWYRLGWYRGRGGRLVRSDRRLPAVPAAPAAVEHDTLRAEAPWPLSLAIEIPAAWPTGMYMAVIRPSIGGVALLPFVVRPPRTQRAPVLFVTAAATWQAYNLWGGANLYDAMTADSVLISRSRRAFQVSFDRPYAQDGGAGFQRRWELQFVRWQERAGRDVDYAADTDFELHPDIAAGRRLIVFAGHHEYWSRPMRETLERAVAGGTNIAFLSANEVYWQVRLEPSPLGAARRITCYKSALLDPLTATDPTRATCRWREAPVAEPEALIVGQMYGHIVRHPADWVVRGADNWLYEGTGLADGDHLVNLGGQEYDAFFADLAHPGTEVLASSPVDAVIHETATTPGDWPSPPIHTATMYTADSGATVFAAGTFQWSLALDDYGDRSYRGTVTPRDPRVETMTRNLFDRLGDGID
ncbi:MAG TPA: N,N-dimethylformamidase beta subunit family domain-containing protein, partial [Candidatus Binatia bacterium]|nr:N,N-dimethylformamidase beta subunit family domain-containing protein [Candidatus Binatia bacterium]